MVPPILPRRLRVPSVPESFQAGASGSPTACHEDFGADEVSKRLLVLEGTIADLCPPQLHRISSAGNCL